MMRSLHWFRNDLRLTDNPALIAASENDVLPVYILDSEDLKDMGQASKLWLHHSLNQLNESLEGKLHFIQGDSINEIRKLIDSEQIDAIYWNRVFEPKKRSKDNDLIKSLEIDYHIFNGSLLWEPESILKDDGTPYKVFTPFYRKGCIKAGKTPREPLPKAKLNFISAQDQTSLDELNLLPVHPWKEKIETKWEGDSLILSTNIPAFQVYLHGIKGSFSDNFFTLLPGEEKLVTIKADNFNVNNLLIWSLFDLKK